MKNIVICCCCCCCFFYCLHSLFQKLAVLHNNASTTLFSETVSTVVFSCFCCFFWLISSVICNLHVDAYLFLSLLMCYTIKHERAEQLSNGHDLECEKKNVRLFANLFIIKKGSYFFPISKVWKKRDLCFHTWSVQSMNFFMVSG